MALQLRAGPLTEPVSLETAKTHLRIDGTDDDLLINSLITAARIFVETSIAKIMISQSWSYFRDAWPKNGTMHLPLSPLISVDEIRLHAEGSFSLLDAEDYAVDLISRDPRIKLRGGPPSPDTTRPLNRIEVQFTAGFGATVSDVPADLVQAVLMLATHWYEQRAPIGHGGAFDDIPAHVSAILAAHKIHRLQ